MDALLRKLYYGPLKGFGNAKDLWKLANTKFKVTQKQAKEFLDKQENQQRYKKSAGFGDLFVPVTAENYTYQSDLMFLTPEKGDYKKRNYVLDPVLVVVEITSRKGYFRSMPDKTTKETAKAMASIIEEIYDANQKIKVIEHDSGSEFIGQEFKRVLMDHDIDSKQYPRAENSKTALSKVERLNGTIRGWWNRYFRGRMSPAEAIPLIQEKYNATKHRATGQQPQHITTKKEYAKVRLEDELRGTEARNNITNNFHVGLKVRLKLPRDVFAKGSEAKWSKGLHTITEQEGYNFKVDNEPKLYRAWELLPVGEVQKAPKKKTPIQVVRRLPAERVPKQLQELVTDLKFKPIPKEPVIPKPISKPAPAVDKSLKAVEFPIRKYEWVAPKSKRAKETLRILVKFSHLAEPLWQDPSIFNLGTKKNPQLNRIFAMDLKKSRLFTRYERAYGKQELSD